MVDTDLDRALTEAAKKATATEPRGSRPTSPTPESLAPVSAASSVSTASSVSSTTESSSSCMSEEPAGGGAAGAGAAGAVGGKPSLTTCTTTTSDHLLPVVRGDTAAAAPRSRVRNGDELLDVFEVTGPDGLVYHRGDSVFVETGKPDLFRICSIIDFRTNKRDEQVAHVREFYRRQDIPEETFQELVDERRHSVSIGAAPETLLSFVEDDSIQDREVFSTDSIQNYPIEALRGRCQLLHFNDITSAQSGLRGRRDHFFYIHFFDHQLNKMANTLNVIRVGKAHQALLPDRLAAHAGPATADSDSSAAPDDWAALDVVAHGQLHPADDSRLVAKEECIWRPGQLADNDLMMFLRATRSVAVAFASIGDFGFSEEGTQSASLDATTQLAFDVLHKSGYSTQAALQTLVAMETPRHPLLKWNEDESRRFVRGLKQYGKNFYRIRKDLLPTKTTKQVIEFYYFWKKSGTVVNGNGAWAAGRRQKQKPRLQLQKRVATPSRNSQPASDTGANSDVSELGSGDEQVIPGDPSTPASNGSDDNSSTTVCKHCGSKESTKWFAVTGEELAAATGSATGTGTGTAASTAVGSSSNSRSPSPALRKTASKLCSDCYLHYKKYGSDRPRDDFVFKPIKSEVVDGLTVSGEAARLAATGRPTNAPSATDAAGVPSQDPPLVKVEARKPNVSEFLSPAGVGGSIHQAAASEVLVKADPDAVPSAVPADRSTPTPPAAGCNPSTLEAELVTTNALLSRVLQRSDGNSCARTDLQFRPKDGTCFAAAQRANALHASSSQQLTSAVTGDDEASRQMLGSSTVHQLQAIRPQKPAAYTSTAVDVKPKLTSGVNEPSPAAMAAAMAQRTRLPSGSTNVADHATTMNTAAMAAAAAEMQRDQERQRLVQQQQQQQQQLAAAAGLLPFPTSELAVALMSGSAPHDAEQLNRLLMAGASGGLPPGAANVLLGLAGGNASQLALAAATGQNPAGTQQPPHLVPPPGAHQVDAGSQGNIEQLLRSAIMSPNGVAAALAAGANPDPIFQQLQLNASGVLGSGALGSGALGSGALGAGVPGSSAGLPLSPAAALLHQHTHSHTHLHLHQQGQANNRLPGAMMNAVPASVATSAAAPNALQALFSSAAAGGASAAAAGAGTGGSSLPNMMPLLASAGFGAGGQPLPPSLNGDPVLAALMAAAQQNPAVGGLTPNPAALLSNPALLSQLSAHRFPELPHAAAAAGVTPDNILNIINEQHRQNAAAGLHLPPKI